MWWFSYHQNWKKRFEFGWEAFHESEEPAYESAHDGNETQRREGRSGRAFWAAFWKLVGTAAELVVVCGDFCALLTRRVVQAKPSSFGTTGVGIFLSAGLRVIVVGFRAAHETCVLLKLEKSRKASKPPNAEDLGDAPSREDTAIRLLGLAVRLASLAVGTVELYMLLTELNGQDEFWEVLAVAMTLIQLLAQSAFTALSWPSSKDPPGQ